MEKDELILGLRICRHRVLLDHASQNYGAIPPMKWAFTARLLNIAALVVALALAAEPMFATTAAPPAQELASANEAPIEFWNREIVVFRTTLAGSTPEERAARTVQRLDELPLNAREQDLVPHSIRVEDQDGIVFTYHGRGLFYLASGDLDKESGETLDQASQSALRNLNEALEARDEVRAKPLWDAHDLDGVEHRRRGLADRLGRYHRRRYAFDQHSGGPCQGGGAG